MSESSAEKTKTSSRLSKRAIAAIIVGSVALLFIFSNTADGTIRFLGLSFAQPVWVWFLIVFVAGVVVGSLFPWFRSKKPTKGN